MQIDMKVLKPEQKTSPTITETPISSSPLLSSYLSALENIDKLSFKDQISLLTSYFFIF